MLLKDAVPKEHLRFFLMWQNKNVCQSGKMCLEVWVIVNPVNKTLFLQHLGNILFCTQ